MKRIALIILLSIGGLSSAALAAQPDTTYGIEVGIRDQSGDVGFAGSSANSQIGYQFGGTVHLPLSGPWALRTGMLYTQRNLVSTDSSGVQTKFTMDYLDVPLAVMYKFEDYAGIFAGVSVAMNIDHNSNNSSVPLTGTKSMIVPILFGTNFKFAPHLGGTLYFETYGGDVADHLSNYRAVGANLYITFD